MRKPKGGKMRRTERFCGQQRWRCRRKCVDGGGGGGLNKVPADPTGDTIAPDVTAGNSNGGDGLGKGSQRPCRRRH